MIWNVWDDSVDWVARMQELVGAHRGDTPQRTTSRWREQLAATGLFTTLTDRTVANVVHGSATLPERERKKLLSDLRALVAEHPEARVQDQLVMPYVTQVTWCRAAE